MLNALICLTFLPYVFDSDDTVFLMVFLCLFLLPLSRWDDMLLSSRYFASPSFRVTVANWFMRGNSGLDFMWNRSQYAMVKAIYVLSRIICTFWYDLSTLYLKLLLFWRFSCFDYWILVFFRTIVNMELMYFVLMNYRIYILNQIYFGYSLALLIGTFSWCFIKRQ